MNDIKNKFPEFYRDKLEKVLEPENSGKVLYVFDTNYFLDVYRLESSIATKFVEAIEQLESNIFIPFQVVLEFHMNRKNVLLGRENNRENFKKQVGHGFDELAKNISNTGSLNFNGKNTFLQDIVTKIDDLKTKLLEDINEKYEDNTKGHKDIEKRIMKVFERYMGEEPSEEEEYEYLKDAKERYKNKQPPGFSDSNKESFYYQGRIRERKYGDLLVWKETVNFLENKEEIEYVVFVSNDGKSNNKTDIRHRVHDKNYDLHVSLISEMYYENKKALYLMTNQEFIEYQIEMTEEEKNRIEEMSINETISFIDDQLVDNINLGQVQRISDQLYNSSGIGQVQRISDQLINSSGIGQAQRISDQLITSSGIGQAQRISDQLYNSSGIGQVQRISDQLINSSGIGQAQRISDQLINSSGIGQAQRISDQLITSSGIGQAQRINDQLQEDGLNKDNDVE